MKTLTVAQIKSALKEKGIAIPSKAKKAELLALLEGKEAPAPKKDKRSYPGEH